MGFHSTAALTHELDEEWKALTTLGLTLDAAKQAATDLMRRYPAHRALARSILDFADDGESDIAGALSFNEARMPRYRERGGATWPPLAAEQQLMEMSEAISLLLLAVR